MRYLHWVKFANLGFFLINKIYWKFEFGFKYLFEFCTFLDIYIWVIFVFALTYFTILLAEYEFITRRVQNFMEENGNKKAIGRH